MNTCTIGSSTESDHRMAEAAAAKVHSRYCIGGDVFSVTVAISRAGDVFSVASGLSFFTNKGSFISYGTLDKGRGGFIAWWRCVFRYS